MIVHSGWFYPVILALALGACNRNDDRPPSSVIRTPPAAAPGPLRTLPVEKTDSIQIEGSWQRYSLTLFQPASSLPFYTYVPAGMVAKTRNSPAGEAHYFFANFAGHYNEDAFLLVFIFPAGTLRADAVRAAERLRDERKSAGFLVPTADVRMHGSRLYYIAESYPGDYGDGFGPRAQRIIDNWQWVEPTSSSPHE
jgi:hypothetical protein